MQNPAKIEVSYRFLRRTQKRKRQNTVVIAAQQRQRRPLRPRLDLRMKRPPKPGQPVLIHYIVDTEHSTELGVTPENFDSRAVEFIRQMLWNGAEFAGLHFTVDRSKQEFTLWFGSTAVTGNYLEQLPSSHGLVLKLTTQLLPGALDVSRDLLLMSSDAEQCAAIALAADLGITIPGFEDNSNARTRRRPDGE